MVDYGELDGLCYLVMDYVEGKPLSYIIRDEAPLAPERVLALARQLALSLQHAHEHGLIHRDFKPDNVIVARDGQEERLRIVDFGLALLPEATEHSRLTSQGMVVGTPVYMAPEQVCASPVDQRTDLYALGIIMYEMLSGQVPFDGVPPTVVRQQLSAEPPRMSERAAVAVEPRLERFVRRLLEKDPAARFQSAREVIEVLDRLRAGGDLDDGSTGQAAREAGARDARARRGRSRWLTVILLVLVMVAGVLGWLVRRDRQQASLARHAAGTGAAAPQELAPQPEQAQAPQPAAQPVGEPGTTAMGAPQPETEQPAATQPETMEPATSAAEAAAPAGVQKQRQPSRANERETRRRKRARDEQADDISPEQISARHRAVGVLVDRLAREQGAAVVKPFRERYLDVPLLDAIRVPALRKDAYQQLGALARDVKRALR